MVHLADALFGEMDVEAQPLVGLLRLPDLVGFVHGQEIALPLRRQRHGQQCAEY
jgi:hypothetical protein